MMTPEDYKVFPHSNDMEGAEALADRIGELLREFKDAGNNSQVPYNGFDAAFSAMSCMMIGAAEYDPSRLHYLVDYADRVWKHHPQRKALNIATRAEAREAQSQAFRIPSLKVHGVATPLP